MVVFPERLQPGQYVNVKTFDCTPVTLMERSRTTRNALTMDVGSLKRRFGVVGNAPALDRALSVAAQVATTDISVLVLGSGTGKEVMPRIVHQFSARKHGPYVAVNCGAIPEGTIDSELWSKRAFTGATETRKATSKKRMGARFSG